MKSMITVEQVARRLQVTNSTIFNWIRDKMLPATKIGYRWYIHEDDLKAFMKPNVPEATNPLE